MKFGYLDKFSSDCKQTTLTDNMYISNNYFKCVISRLICLLFSYSHSLLDAKINSVLSFCHDQTILNAVQSIIQNMIACGDASQLTPLSYLKSIGFGGLWRFAGPFTKVNKEISLSLPLLKTNSS